MASDNPGAVQPFSSVKFSTNRNNDHPAFDVTPAKLVTGFITERGVCEASRDGLLSLYPEKKSVAA